MLIPILDKLINISTYLGLLVLEQNFSKIYIDEVYFKGFLLSNEKKKDILLIYCHGGGYVLGNPMDGILMFNQLFKQNQINLTIFTLEYTLYNPYKAYQELSSSIIFFKKQNFNKIYLMGTSAGGHLVLNYSLNTPIEKIILLSPWINPNEKINHFNDYMPPKLINQVGSLIKAENLMNEINFLNNDNLKKLQQKILIIYGSRECFKEQIEKFIEKVKPRYYKGLKMPHAFLILPFSDSKIKIQALDYFISFLIL